MSVSCLRGRPWTHAFNLPTITSPGRAHQTSNDSALGSSILWRTGAGTPSELKAYDVSRRSASEMALAHALMAFQFRKSPRGALTFLTIHFSIRFIFLGSSAP